VSWRPNPRSSARTSFQDSVLSFQSAVEAARLTLTEEQFAAFVSVLTAWAARANRELLERDELRRRRRSA
jgi:hypothetical protein